MKKSNILKNVYCLFVCVFTAMAVWISTAEVEASFGDPFDGDGLKNSDWQWQNEPEKWDVGETREGFLYIDSEHDRDRNLWASDMSHFLYQETETDVFDVETHFFSRWATDSGVNGLLVKSEADNNWVTLKFWSRAAANQGQIQFQTKQVNVVNDAGWRPVFGDTELFFRLKKDINQYTAWYKTEAEADWQQVGTTTFTLTPPLRLGIYAGVATSVGTLEVEYEYFKDNMNPFPVEPAGKATTTWGTLKTRY